MDETNGTSVRRTYNSYPPEKIYRYIASANTVECKLIIEMARAASLLVVTKMIEAQHQVIELNEITEVLHSARKKVLELPEAKKLPLNWPFKTANRFYTETIVFLTGKQPVNELSMQIIQRGYETEMNFRFGTS